MAEARPSTSSRRRWSCSPGCHYALAQKAKKCGAQKATRGGRSADPHVKAAAAPRKLYYWAEVEQAGRTKDAEAAFYAQFEEKARGNGHARQR